jgi:secondary thiamine-phosphate synthase enzyme
MQQLTETLTLPTRGQGLYEFTQAVRDFIAGSEVSTGLLTVFVRHTSCSLLIQENADPDVQADLERFLSRLVPDADPIFRHTAEGPDDMPAHVRAALTQTHLAIPVQAGEPMLGTWQGLYLYEHRRQGHRRQVVLHLAGETGNRS